MVERSFDYEAIRQVAMHPQILSSAADDNFNADHWSLGEDAWLIARLSGQVIGAISFRQINGVTVEIHPMILPIYRGKFAYQAVRNALQWVMEHTACQKVICFIPTMYRGIKLFALRCGMSVEGMNKQSFLKGGALRDQWMLGITRDEVLNHG